MNLETLVDAGTQDPREADQQGLMNLALKASMPRVFLPGDPFVDWSKGWTARGAWPARWIRHPAATGTAPVVQAFRLRFALAAAARIRIHVSADERYDLQLDGERLGRGPERCDPRHWRYESFDLSLAAGEHLLLARCWWFGHLAPAPCAQMSLRPAFLLAAEGEGMAALSTGIAPWQTRILTGYKFVWPYKALPFTGPRQVSRGSEMIWNLAQTEAGWDAPEPLAQAVNASMFIEQAANVWLLQPATLPPMVDAVFTSATVRHVQAVAPGENAEALRIQDAANLPAETAAFTALLQNSAPVTVEAHSRRRVLIDLGDYACAYPEVTVTGGRSASIRLGWAEALHDERGWKTNRNEIQGLTLAGELDTPYGRVETGFFDEFHPEGGARRLFDTFWWSAGRYLQLEIVTADEPLRLESVVLRETHYPHRFTGSFACSDPRLAALLPMFRRTLEMCSHETYVDCPYYEQTMYVGDTRLEILQTYVTTPDARLPAKAITEFDRSRLPNGLTQSRYPTRLPQIIAPFSLYWVAMVHDFMMWKPDAAFVRARMPGVRAVLEAFRGYLNADGLLEAPDGWNFVDWVPGWPGGNAPESDRGVSSILNLQLVYTLRLAAELEAFANEPLLAARNRLLADRLAQTVRELFWDEGRGLFADDRARTSFSEHAQCFSLLSGSVRPEQQPVLENALLTAPDLHRATIYFSHYLFEALRLLRRPDRILSLLEFWAALPGQGFKTTPEMPEPSRSDCHAWGSHPMFHFPATLLGIRPSAPGFAQVRIEPQLGSLEWARGAMPHPLGEIRVALRQRDGHPTGEIELPVGLRGVFLAAGSEIPLDEGRTTIDAGRVIAQGGPSEVAEAGEG